MDSCDRRIRAYKNGKTFDQCREIAESMNPDFKKHIESTCLIRVNNQKAIKTPITKVQNNEF